MLLKLSWKFSVVRSGDSAGVRGYHDYFQEYRGLTLDHGLVPCLADFVLEGNSLPGDHLLLRGLCLSDDAAIPGCHP